MVTATETPTKAPEAPRLRTFRNPSDTRQFYLGPRAGQKTDFVFGPGMTITAKDEAEQTLLASMSGLVVDVEKEAPVVGGVIQDLQLKLEAEKEKNRRLTAEKADLEKKQAATARSTAARARRS